MRISLPRSFRAKLLILVALATSVGVIVEGVIMRLIETMEVRPMALSELSTDAAVIATHSAAALAFGDRAAGTETLAALRAAPNVVSARIFDRSGAPFSAYQRAGEPPALSPVAPLRGHRFENTRLTLGRAIMHEREQLGTLMIVYDLSDYYGRIIRNAFIWLAISVVAVGVAVLPALRLQRGLARPVSALVATSRRISQTNDYSLRATRYAADELGELTTSFNNMLSRIQERDSDLARARQALENSNEQLQQFAYVASHDLQEPLRKIQTFGGMLESELGEALGPEARDYLERMEAAAGRMRSLIEALLAYSRVTGKAQAFTDVDLNETVEGVLSDLEVRIAETGGRVEVGVLPSLRADALQMRQLLQNLIANALKFHRPGVPPVVRVQARCLPADGGQPAHWQITVEDNGIGFEQKYADRIFVPFHRLHGRGQYEGTGMGLAVCRRIADRHGWRISVVSEPDKGTTFTIDCPLRGDRPETSTEPGGPTTPTALTEATEALALKGAA